MLLFSAAVIPLYKEVCPASNSVHITSLVFDVHPSQTNLDVENLSEFLETILKWVLETADGDLQKNAAIHLVAVIVNRKADGECNQPTIEWMVSERIAFVF